jgi:hypothetical protein
LGCAQQLGGSEEGGEAWASSQSIGPFDVGSSTLVNGGGTGLVVVAPDAPKRAELDEIRNLLKLTPGPLLGVMTYAPQSTPRGSKSTGRRSHSPVEGNEG